MNVGDEYARDPRDDGQAEAVRLRAYTLPGAVVRLVDRPLVLQARLGADYRQHGAYRALRRIKPIKGPIELHWTWKPKPQDAPGSTQRSGVRL